MKRLLTIILASGLSLFFTLASGQSSDESAVEQRIRERGARIYDSHSRYKGRIDRQGRIFGPSGRFKGRVDGGKLYDSSSRYKGKVENTDINDVTESD